MYLINECLFHVSFFFDPVTRQCIAYSGFKKSKAIYQQILMLCLKLSKECPWHLQVIIFFMGAETIDCLTSEVTELTLYLTLSNDKNGSRIQPLLIDVLRSKILYQHIYSTQNDSAITNCESSKVHKQLARKTVAIENYPFQADGVAAWKCGGTLLTMRIGSDTSLYRGWVEIVHRTASSTTRRMVRCDKDISASNPDNLLRFWDMLQTPKGDLLIEESVPTPKQQHQTESEEDKARLKLLTDARSLMQQFDQVIQDGLEANELENIMSKSSDSLTFDLRANSFSSNEPESVINTHPMFKPRKLKRNVSDGNIAYILTQPEEKSEPLQNSVISWMENTFDEYFDRGGVIRELMRLGFSSSTKNRSSEALCHDKLRPCKMGANFTRALNILDRATPFQTHRVSLLYGGPLSQKASNKTNSSNATDGDQFLLATQASTDFWDFAKDLGSMVPVRHLRYFSGGLDTSESSSDGSFAIVWFKCKGDTNNDDVPAIVDSMVMFHTVT